MFRSLVLILETRHILSAATIGSAAWAQHRHVAEPVTLQIVGYIARYMAQAEWGSNESPR